MRAPWLVIAVVAGCGGGPAPGARPPAVDRAAAQRLLELREQRLREQPPSDEDFAATGLGAAGCPAAQPDCAADLERGCAGREHDRAYARVALQLLGGAVSPLWLAAQRCAALLAPRRGGELTRERARAWSAAGEPTKLCACLDGCALTDADRAEIERLENGDGYAQRIRGRLAGAVEGVGRMASAEDAARIAAALKEARDDLRAHARQLGGRAADLQGELASCERRLAARLPGIAEVQLLNLAMRAVNALDVIERLIPDPIDIDGARAEVQGCAQILEHMRGVIAAAGSLLRSAAEWSAQVDALERRFGAARGRVDARVQRRIATLELLLELCRLDRDRDQAVQAGAADPARRRELAARRHELEERQRDRLKQLRGYKARYDRRRDCAAPFRR